MRRTFPPVKSRRRGAGNRLIGLFGTMILFFMLFDGILSYVVPLAAVERGFSTTLVGVILSAAAVFGALFDFIIYRIFKEAFYRRLFIFMFAAALVYVGAVWSAHSLAAFIAAMAVWGFYYDLKNFGTLDFVARYSPPEKLSSNFGLIQVFQSMGYLLAPLLAGFVVVASVNRKPFLLALLFLLVAVFFFSRLASAAGREKQVMTGGEAYTRRGLRETAAAWRRVGKGLWPLLALASFSTVYDSFYMTLGPLVAETLPLEPWDGVFMMAYLLPPLLMGGLVGRLTGKFGEKNTVLLGLLIGSMILTVIFLFASPPLLILIVFISSGCTCLMAPVIQSLFGHAIHDAPEAEKEVQELGDFFGNCGYILGPLLAGFLGDTFGYLATFALLGGMGLAFTLLLMIFLPKRMGLTP